jgi:hypothetical protein
MGSNPCVQRDRKVGSSSTWFFICTAQYGGPNALLIFLYKLCKFYVFLYIYHENNHFPLLSPPKFGQNRERKQHTFPISTLAGLWLSLHSLTGSWSLHTLSLISLYKLTDSQFPLSTLFLVNFFFISPLYAQLQAEAETILRYRWFLVWLPQWSEHYKISRSQAATMIRFDPLTAGLRQTVRLARWANVTATVDGS